MKSEVNEFNGSRVRVGAEEELSNVLQVGGFDPRVMRTLVEIVASASSVIYAWKFRCDL